MYNIKGRLQQDSIKISQETQCFPLFSWSNAEEESDSSTSSKRRILGVVVDCIVTTGVPQEEDPSISSQRRILTGDIISII